MKGISYNKEKDTYRVTIFFDGKRKSFGKDFDNAPFKSLDKAIKFKNEVELKYNYHDVINPRKKIINQVEYVYDILRAYYKEGVFIRYKSFYECHVLPYFGELRPVILQNNHLRQYRDNINNLKISKQSKKTIFVASKGFLKVILESIPNQVDLSILKTNKNEYAKRQELRFYTEEEFKKFISQIEDPEIKLMFSMFFLMGLRKSELKGLYRSDLDRQKKVLHIYKQAFTKNKGQVFKLTSLKTSSSTRDLPVPNIIFKLYDKVPYKKGEKFMFPNRRFTKHNPVIADNTIQYNNMIAAKKAGLPVIRIHDFRHSCAINLFKQNIEPTIISKYLGHKDVAVTLSIYIHALPSEMIKIKNALDNVKLNE